MSALDNVNHALIESSILLNSKELLKPQITSLNTTRERRLSDVNENSIESEIAKITPDFDSFPELEKSLTLTFNSFPIEDLKESALYAINYIFQNHKSIGISEVNLLNTIKSILASFVDSGASRGSNLEESYPGLVVDVYELLLPLKISTNNYSIPNWSKNLSKIFIDVASSESVADIKSRLQQKVIEDISKSNLQILNNFEYSTGNFIPKITPVDTSRKLENPDMLFGGENRFMKFNPSKTAILQFSSRGLAEGIFDESNNAIDINSVEKLADMIGNSVSTSTISFLTSLVGDNSLFAYESINAISTGITLGAVYKVSQNETYRDNDLPYATAESISNSIASQSITTSLNMATGFELHRVSESVAFGTSMGAQLSTVLDKSLDYEKDWELFSRTKLAEATSKGSANGAINAASQFIENDPNIPDTFGTTSRKEILQIASGSALGSLMGNTGLAIYYPTTMQIIKSASQGVSMGGITAQNLAMVDKPKGVTEEFEVEIARALAFGASEGALFQVISLQNKSNPKSPEFETLAVETAESVSYGTAYGAVTGGIKSGEDPLIVKQAINQGVTEGSSVGISLALGYDATVANNVKTKSNLAINSAIQKTVSEAASSANDSMSVKRIQTSSRDMLLLMRKFNINPLFTNPTKIFSNPAKKEEEAPKPLKDEFPVASPI